ncbi:hypothetical protein V2O64_24640 (plasmid) [Verrucomicrobiaceae bacterium 227]
MEIPAEWILGVIGTLAGIIYHSLSSRIKDQSKIIDKLQGDIDRLSKGCGVAHCLWKER